MTPLAEVAPRAWLPAQAPPRQEPAVSEQLALASMLQAEVMMEPAQGWEQQAWMPVQPA
jgi:hypothetical protein